MKLDLQYFTNRAGKQQLATHGRTKAAHGVPVVLDEYYTLSEGVHEVAISKVVRKMMDHCVLYQERPRCVVVVPVSNSEVLLEHSGWEFRNNFLVAEVKYMGDTFYALPGMLLNEVVQGQPGKVWVSVRAMQSKLSGSSVDIVGVEGMESIKQIHEFKG